jgi:hypothetical protein
VDSGHALDDGLAKPVSFDALRASGTWVEVRTSRLAAGDINLMDPHQIAPALALGAGQSAEDAADLVAFFGV